MTKEGCNTRRGSLILPFNNVKEASKWTSSLESVGLFDVSILSLKTLIIHNAPRVGTLIESEHRTIHPLLSEVGEKSMQQVLDQPFAFEII